MGAVTVAFVKRQTEGGTARTAIVDITFSGTYAAGGDTYTPSQFGMTTVHAIIPTGAALGSSTTAYAVRADIANSKIQLFNSNGAAPAALLETSTGNQASTVARCLVIGDAPYI